MRVLIGCEESGTVREAFLAKGHEAYSNDLIPARDGGPHLQMCVKEAIRNHGPWDLIILHPVCTAMALSGNRWYGKDMPKHQERLDAIDWTVDLWMTAKKYSKACALENPTSVIFQYLFADVQYVQPWQFGHGETKRTGLALHNLPRLEPTDIVEGREQRVWKMAPSPTRKRDRSKTYDGIAAAIADQWGSIV